MIINRNKIIDAAYTLLSVCDGAQTKDGEGFNQPDSKRIKKLLSYDSLTDNEIIDISERLVKYHNQLEGFGYDISTLKPVFEKAKEGTKIRLDSKGEHETTYHESWDKVKIEFGQYKGESLGEILTKNPSYISWLAINSYNDDIKEACQLIIEGKPIKIPESYIILGIHDNKVTMKSSMDYNDRIKELSDKAWNGEFNYWVTPLRNFDEVIEKFPEAKHTPEFADFVASKQKLHSMSRLTESTKEFALGNFGHGKSLYPFQKAGLEFLETANGRAIISDEMGVGKTIQALAYAQLHQEARPILIVSPSSVKGNWQNEGKAWLDTNDTFEVLSGKKPYKPSASIIIINYDILNPWTQILKEYNPKIIIFDEAHRLRNPKTIRAQAAFKISENADHVIELTGTPIINSPKELYSLLYLVAPDMYNFDGFNNFKFLQRYCGGTFNGYGWTFSGAENLDELANKLKYVMIRRTKKGVGLELPDKTRTAIFVELTNKKKAESATDAFKKWYENSKIPEKRAQNEKVIANITNDIAKLKGELLLDPDNEQTKAIIERYKGELHQLANDTYNFSPAEIAEIELGKQMVADGKYKAIKEWITDFIESGEKLVVFAWHTKLIDKLMKEFGSIAVKIDGSVESMKRTKIIEQFQTDPKIKLFIGNIQAAGEGTTLTASSNVLFTELPWTPSALQQCEDRTHRMTQKNAVNCWYMLSKDTVEEFIMDKIEHKRDVISQTLDEVDELNFAFYEDKT